jgi:hypothetical protein
MDFVQEVKRENISMFAQGKSFLSGAITTRNMKLQFDGQNRIKPIDIEGSFMELHFQLNGFSETLVNDKKITLYPNSQSIFF